MVPYFHDDISGEDLARSVIENYFGPIIAGRVEVHVKHGSFEKQLKRDTIEAAAASLTVWPSKGSMSKEQVVSYRRNVSPAFLSLAKALYFNPATGGVRRGATTDPKKENDRGGQWRELDRVIGRLDLTYDVFGAVPEELKQLLPARRFRRWN